MFLGIACIVLSLVICFVLTPLFNASVAARADIVRMSKDVRRGEMITGDMVALVSVGGYNLPADAARSRDSVIGRYARHDMLSGDYILSGKLSDAPIAEFSYLQDLDGSRLAISVTIKSFAAGLSGKLDAGDVVRIMAVSAGDDKTATAPPELRYVKVLAATDARGYDKGDDGSMDDEKRLPSSVTLLVTQEQALLLAELESGSVIHCALVYRGSEAEAGKLLKAQDDYFAAQPDGGDEGAAHGE
jgi:pilus assembly protein CpaB